MAFTDRAEDLLQRHQLGGALPPGLEALAGRLQRAESDPFLESYRREALGLLALLKGDAETAARELDAAVRADHRRESPQLWLVATDLAAAQGDYQRAAQRAAERLTQRPCLHDWLLVAGAAKLRNDFATLERAARAALELEPEEPSAHFALGLALLRKNPKSDEAMQALLRAAESVTDGELVFAVATARALRGETAGSLRLLRLLLEELPDTQQELRERVRATLTEVEAAEGG